MSSPLSQNLTRPFLLPQKPEIVKSPVTVKTSSPKMDTPVENIEEKLGLDLATSEGSLPEDIELFPADVSVGKIAFNHPSAFKLPDLTIFDLIPNRLEGALSLSDVLDSLPDTPEAQAAMTSLIENLSAQTGMKIQPSMIQAAIGHPSRLLNLLQVSSKQLSMAMDPLTLLHQAKGGEKAEKAYKLPKNFDLGDISSIEIELPKDSESAIGAGLFRGSLVNTELSPEAAKTNIVMAEIFDRLSANTNSKDQDRFHVTYKKSNYSRVDTFMKALKDDGYTIKAKVKHRIANFSELYVKGSNGERIDVPAPLMVRTGITSENGEEALVPATHSDLIFEISSGEKSSQKLDSKIKFYQGITTTGFYPHELYQTPAWTSGKIADVMTGNNSFKALELAGLLSDIINDVADDLGLAAAGYGITGVCNDSVAIVQFALTGKVTGFPLLMRNQILLKEVESRLSDTNHKDDPRYKQLLEAIKAVPSDMQMTETTAARALSSLPYAEGEAPFVSSERAQQILSQNN